MALRFHARRKIPQRFFPPSQIHPARCRAKAALLNSSSTPSEELTSHVIIIVSRALSQRAKTESWSFCDLYYSFRHSLPTWENLRGIFEAILYFFHTVSHQISIVHFANNEEIPLHKRVTKDCVLFRSFHYRHPLLPCPFIQWTKSSLRGRKSLFANRVIITTENHRSTWKQVVLFSSG